MKKIKVGLAGEFYTERQKASLLALNTVLLQKSEDIELIGFSELVLSVITEEDSTDPEMLRDIFLNAVDDSEAFVIAVPSVDEGGLDTVGWMLSYCWNSGVPAVLVDLSGGTSLKQLSAMTSHANLTTLKGLYEYNFVELPLIAANPILHNVNS